MTLQQDIAVMRSRVVRDAANQDAWQTGRAVWPMAKTC